METCLEKSVEQYRKIVAHAEQLDKLLKKADPEMLRQYTQQLRDLQEEACVYDKDVINLPAERAAAVKNLPLYQERTQLIERIVKLNHLLLPRIRGMMAVAAHEIAQIKGGRVAMAGYHQPTARHNRSRGIG